MTLTTITWKPGITLPHDPNASDIYRWNWLDWLDGETISAQSIVADAGITATLVTLASTYVDIRISGGTAGQAYGVTSRVTSSPNGRIQDRTVNFAVRER